MAWLMRQPPRSIRSQSLRSQVFGPVVQSGLWSLASNLWPHFSNSYFLVWHFLKFLLLTFLYVKGQHVRLLVNAASDQSDSQFIIDAGTFNVSEWKSLISLEPKLTLHYDFPIDMDQDMEAIGSQVIECVNHSDLLTSTILPFLARRFHTRHKAPGIEH